MIQVVNLPPEKKKRRFSTRSLRLRISQPGQWRVSGQRLLTTGAYTLLAWQQPGVQYPCHALLVNISNASLMANWMLQFDAVSNYMVLSNFFLKEDRGGTVPWLPQILWLKYKIIIFLDIMKLLALFYIWWFMFII